MALPKDTDLTHSLYLPHDLSYQYTSLQDKQKGHKRNYAKTTTRLQKLATTLAGEPSQDQSLLTTASEHLRKLRQHHKIILGLGVEIRAVRRQLDSEICKFNIEFEELTAQLEDLTADAQARGAQLDAIAETLIQKRRDEIFDEYLNRTECLEDPFGSSLTEEKSLPPGSAADDEEEGRSFYLSESEEEMFFDLSPADNAQPTKPRLHAPVQRQRSK